MKERVSITSKTPGVSPSDLKWEKKLEGGPNFEAPSPLAPLAGTALRALAITPEIKERKLDHGSVTLRPQFDSQTLVVGQYPMGPILCLVLSRRHYWNQGSIP